MNEIDKYIEEHEGVVKERLILIRKVIKEEAKECIEKFSWRMPTFYYKENLIHFAAFKNHIGIYPGSEAIEAFSEEFQKKKLKFSKGAVQFPNKEDLDLELITRITRYRVKCVEDSK